MEGSFLSVKENRHFKKRIGRIPHNKYKSVLMKACTSSHKTPSIGYDRQDWACQGLALSEIG